MPQNNTLYPTLDFAGHFTKGVQLAIGLENLDKMRKDAEMQRQIQQASELSLKPSPAQLLQTGQQTGIGDTSGMSVNVGATEPPKIDHSQYVTRLDQVDPAKAVQYRHALAVAEKVETDVQGSKLKLDEQKTASALGNFSNAAYYLKSTGDADGALNLISKASDSLNLPPEQRITKVELMPNGRIKAYDYQHPKGRELDLDNIKLGEADKNTRAALYNQRVLQQMRLDWQKEREREEKFKLPKPPTATDIRNIGNTLLQHPVIGQLPEEHVLAISGQVAQRSRDLQVRAANQKKEPPSTQEAQEFISEDISNNEVIPAVPRNLLAGPSDFTLGKDMIWAPRMRSIIQKYKNDPNGAETLHRLYDLHKRYTTPSALKKAILNKDLSQEDAADLIRIMQNQ